MDALLDIDYSSTDISSNEAVDYIGKNYSELASNPTTSPLAVNVYNSGLVGQPEVPLSISTAVQINSPTNISNTDFSETSGFKIEYVDYLGSKKEYLFSLLPAMESKFSGGATAQVPEIKPGILAKTSMNIKRFLIPGGPPVFQVMGIEQTILQLVGLFIGNEGVGTEGTGAANALYKPLLATLNAQKTSQIFDREVVQSGQPVILSVSSASSKFDNGLSLQYKCLLQNFRVFIARSDRVYYAMDAIVLEYAQGGYVKPLIRPPGTDLS